MIDERLPMGKSINTHFGFIEMDSDILEVGFFDDHLIVVCELGTYKITKDNNGIIKKEIENAK